MTDRHAHIFLILLPFSFLSQLLHILVSNGIKVYAHHTKKQTNEQIYLWRHDCMIQHHLGASQHIKNEFTFCSTQNRYHHHCVFVVDTIIYLFFSVSSFCCFHFIYLFIYLFHYSFDFMHSMRTEMGREMFPQFDIWKTKIEWILRQNDLFHFEVTKAKMNAFRLH